MADIDVASNIGKTMERSLAKAFAGNALGTANPNTLNGGVPSQSNSMGICRSSGIVSFSHNNGAQVSVTVYYWSSLVGQWLLLGPVASVYTIPVDSGATGSCSVKAGMRLFFEGSLPSPNFYIGGATYDNASQNGVDIAS